MSMSMRVEGITGPNEKWRKMKAIWDACQEADTDPPEAVLEFFKGRAPDEKGVVVSLGSTYGHYHAAITDHRAEMEEGFTVDLSKLPKDVTIIRFVCSY